MQEQFTSIKLQIKWKVKQCFLCCQVRHDQQFFISKRPRISINTFIFRQNEIICPVNSNGISSPKSDKLFVMMIDGIRVLLRPLHIDFRIIRIHLHPWLAAAETSVFRVAPLHWCSRVVPTVLPDYLHDFLM
ncbi:hypothetical protein D3C76_1275410 [compost metagenome]